MLQMTTFKVSNSKVKDYDDCARRTTMTARKFAMTARRCGEFYILYVIFPHCSLIRSRLTFAVFISTDNRLKVTYYFQIIVRDRNLRDVLSCDKSAAQIFARAGMVYEAQRRAILL